MQPPPTPTTPAVTPGIMPPTKLEDAGSHQPAEACLTLLAIQSIVHTYTMHSRVQMGLCKLCPGYGAEGRHVLVYGDRGEQPHGEAGRDARVSGHQHNIIYRHLLKLSGLRSYTSRHSCILLRVSRYLKRKLQKARDQLLVFKAVGATLHIVDMVIIMFPFKDHLVYYGIGNPRSHFFDPTDTRSDCHVLPCPLLVAGSPGDWQPEEGQRLAAGREPAAARRPQVGGPILHGPQGPLRTAAAHQQESHEVSTHPTIHA